MRRFAAGFVVVVAVGSLLLPQATGGPKRTPNYYPLKAGSQWHYRVDVDGQPGQVTNRVAKIEKIDGQPLARLETVAQGNVAASEHLGVTPKGLFRYRYNGIEVNPPVCLLKFPVKDGQTWQSDAKIAGQKLTLRCREGREEVTVPAGKYKAVTADVEAEVGGMKITTKYWFAEGVGVVKQTANLAGKNVTLELEKFEPGK